MRSVPSLAITAMFLAALSGSACAQAPSQAKPDALTAWRDRIVVGTDTHCGPVRAANPPLYLVYTGALEVSFRADELFPSGVAACPFTPKSTTQATQSERPKVTSESLFALNGPTGWVSTTDGERFHFLRIGDLKKRDFLEIESRTQREVFVPLEDVSAIVFTWRSPKGVPPLNVTFRDGISQAGSYSDIVVSYSDRPLWRAHGAYSIPGFPFVVLDPNGIPYVRRIKEYLLKSIEIDPPIHWQGKSAVDVIGTTEHHAGTTATASALKTEGPTTPQTGKGDDQGARGNTVKEALGAGLAAYRSGDYQKAVSLLTPLAKNGDMEAQYRLGVFYDTDLGRKIDRKQRDFWYGKAAAQGHIGARYKIEFSERYPFPPQPRDVNWTPAVAYYRAAAEQGDADAQANLGLMYELGAGIPTDSQQRDKWYLKAADQGNISAQLSMAAIEIDRDPQRAAYWYRKAAEQGSLGGQEMLGAAYESGRGVPQDYDEAIRWFARAAGNGEGDGWWRISAIFRLSWSPRYNLVLAYAYHDLAVKAGSAWAPSRDLEELAAKLRPEQLREAKSMAANWKPGQPLPMTTNTWKATTVKAESPTATKANGNLSPPSSTTPYPAAPAKRPGVASCNTTCRNGDCYRTYDDGRKVHFQAPQKWNPFENRFDWDSGSC